MFPPFSEKKLLKLSDPQFALWKYPITHALNFLIDANFYILYIRIMINFYVEIWKIVNIQQYGSCDRYIKNIIILLEKQKSFCLPYICNISNYQSRNHDFFHDNVLQQVVIVVHAHQPIFHTLIIAVKIFNIHVTGDNDVMQCS